MTDKLTFSEHTEEKEDNSGLRALDVNEDFIYKIFSSATDNHNIITDTSQWYISKYFILARIEFIKGLQNACLVDQSDLDNMNSFWILKTKEARSIIYMFANILKNK